MASRQQISSNQSLAERLDSPFLIDINPPTITRHQSNISSPPPPPPPRRRSRQRRKPPAILHRRHQRCRDEGRRLALAGDSSRSVGLQRLASIADFLYECGIRERRARSRALNKFQKFDVLTDTWRNAMA